MGKKKKKKSRAKVKLFELSHIEQGTVLGGITEKMIGIDFRREMGEESSCLHIHKT